MFTAFFDESGSDAREPMLMTAAWVGRVEDWEKFSDEWQAALEADNPKPLGLHKNERYFKHNEAIGREGCFAGFSVREAQQKMVNLASVIARYDLAAYALMLERERYFRMVDEMAVIKSGKLYRDYIKDPLYLLLHHLVQIVLHTQYATNPNDNVDFIFDSGGMSDRVAEVFKFAREFSPQFLPPIMGALIPMDDKKVMPLQAADLFAGQVRAATQYGGFTVPLLVLKQMNRRYIDHIDDASIRAFLTLTNISISTRRLTAIRDRN